MYRVETTEKCLDFQTEAQALNYVIAKLSFVGRNRQSVKAQAKANGITIRKISQSEIDWE